MTATTESRPAPPSPMLMLAEARAFWEGLASVAMWPALQLAPRGDGHGVLVLPGLVASDLSTGLLRYYLQGRGYAVQGWEQGRNLGPRPGVEAAMERQLVAINEATGRKVSIVGWSLGGIYARMLASRHADRVRTVITMGSPFRGSERSNNAWRVYEKVSRQHVDDPDRLELVRPTPPVPTTSIYSRSDGIVAWHCSVETAGPQSENIEVIASHIGLGVHPAVLYAVADRLSQPEGNWKPFNRDLLGPFIYPPPASREPEAP